MPYDKTKISQKWEIDDETGRVVNVGSGMCLNDDTRVMGPIGRSSVKVSICNQQDEGQEWDLEQIKCITYFSPTVKAKSNYANFGNYKILQECQYRLLKLIQS